MILVLMGYLLLAMPLRGVITASISDAKGNAAVRIGLPGCDVMHFTAIAVGKDGWPLLSASIRGAPARREETNEFGLRKKLDIAVRKTIMIEEIDLSMRIGLGEAWGTALAVGSAKAALNSALCMLRSAGRTRVCVIPDFTTYVFCAHLRCIFSVTAGDIILRAAVSTIKKAAEKGVCHAAASHSESDGDIHGEHPGDGGRQYRHR